MLHFLLFAVLVLISSALMVRLWMQLIIPLPLLSDRMIDLALKVYGAENQEEVADALALTGFLFWIPITGLICWGALRLWKHLRKR